MVYNGLEWNEVGGCAHAHQRLWIFFSAQGSGIHFVNLRLCRWPGMNSTALIERAALFWTQQRQPIFHDRFFWFFIFIEKAKLERVFLCASRKKGVFLKCNQHTIHRLHNDAYYTGWPVQSESYHICAYSVVDSLDFSDTLTVSNAICTVRTRHVYKNPVITWFGHTQILHWRRQRNI